jgi:hypothetical protein
LGKRNISPPLISFQNRRFDSVRVINPLKCGLTPHAKLTLVDGVKGIPFDFDNASLSVFGNDSATRRALSTGRRIPLALTGNHIIGSMNQRIKELFGFWRATGGK